MAPHEQAELATIGGADVGPVVDVGVSSRLSPAKRCFDVVVAVCALLVLLPLVVAVGLAVRLTSPGPILFGQERVGLGGRRFRCWKFRTMHHDAEWRLQRDEALYARYLENDFKLEAHEDPRLTPIGNFLRRSSLDELPQFFNVLGGTMSLVGPRPVVAEELDCYGPWTDDYLSVRPGITGPWQTNGRNEIRYPERAELDADYVRNWSLATDVRLLVRTVPAVLRRKGVF